MTFDEILAQVLDLLQREKRLSYRALKIRFGLDDEHLAALKDEIIEAKQLAVDDRGVVLVWTGEGVPAPSATASASTRVSFATMPAYLAEKIRTTRGALAGERKQVTVLFADVKDSTGTHPRPRSRSRPAAPRPCAAAYDGRRAPLRGHGEPGPGRWHHGPVWGAARARGPRAARLLRGPGDAGRHPCYTEEVRRAHGLEMRIRVGLNSGEVVVRAISNDLHMDYSAVGETTHLAAAWNSWLCPAQFC